MSLKQYLLQGVVAAACLLQVGCKVGGEAADLRNPSVAELDAADVRWGLQPRKGKGAPKRSYQYQMDDDAAGRSGAARAVAPVVSAPSDASAPEAPATLPPAPSPQIDVNKLR